jgi:hypothetical protein
LYQGEGPFENITVTILSKGTVMNSSENVHFRGYMKPGTYGEVAVAHPIRCSVKIRKHGILPFVQYKYPVLVSIHKRLGTAVLLS